MSSYWTHLTVDYGRRTYVFGLPWFSADPEDNIKKLAFETIKTSRGNFDTAVFKSGESPQYALASKSDGVKTGSYSGAAALASIMGTDKWLYVVELGSHIWICYGREGFILPEGDRVYKNEEEAKAEFLKLEPNKWKRISVPASWKTAGAFDIGWDRFLESDEIAISNATEIMNIQVKPWMRINTISPMGSILKIGAAAGVIIALGYFGQGFVYNDTSSKNQDRYDVQRLMAERAKKQKEEAFAVYDAEKPWLNEPSSKHFIAQCLTEIGKQPSEMAGYLVTSLDCTPNEIVLVLKQGPETFPNWLSEYSSLRPEFSISLSGDASAAFASISTAPIPNKGEIQLAKYAQVSNELRNAASVSQSRLSLSSVKVKPNTDHDDYVPLFGKSDLNIETNNPTAWLDLLTSNGGISITSVHLLPETMNYILKGHVYVQNR